MIKMSFIEYIISRFSHNQESSSESSQAACGLFFFLEFLLLRPVICASHQGESCTHAKSVRAEVEPGVVARPEENLVVLTVDRQKIKRVDESKEGAVEKPSEEVTLELASSVFASVHVAE